MFLLSQSLTSKIPFTNIYINSPFEERMQMLSHEILHALGLNHEQQNTNSQAYLTINPPKSQKCHYILKENSVEILNYARFDPLSIMIYDESQALRGKRRYFTNFWAFLCRHRDEDPVWTLVSRAGFTMGKQMSPIDQLKLNVIYPPYSSLEYYPKISDKTGLYYCGRNVMEYHNYPDKGCVEFCGPEKGPNCAACRTIKNDKIPIFNEKGDPVWQGYSGIFYCGKYFQKMAADHDGKCGPDNGYCCKSCQKLIS